MKEVAATDAKERFGLLLEAAQQAPVRLTRRGRPIGVLMSPEQYERLRGGAWSRLAQTMDRLGAEAKAAGLTEEALDKLLADEG